MQPRYNNYGPWLMWLLPLLFFAFQFVLRLFPGLVINDFYQKYDISAKEFGLFASLYYVGYALFQIPMAIFLDKFGARTVLTVCTILCGLAALMINFFDSWHAALISRFLIGSTSVAGFLGVSKIVSSWFKPEQYSRLIGLTFSFGLLGAVYGGTPISHLIDSFGWQIIGTACGIFSICLGIVMWIFLREPSKNNHPSIDIQRSLGQLLRNKSLLLLAMGNFLLVGTLEGFADVWGVSFLMTAREITKSSAAGITSFIFIGMLFGGPILAALAERLKSQFQVTLLSGMLMSILISICLFYARELPTAVLISLMFIIGILCCYQVLIFAIGSQLVSPMLLSLTIAFLNCINMLGGSFFHNTIGATLSWLNQRNDTIDSVHNFTVTLMIIPISAILGVFLVHLSQRLKVYASNNQTKKNVANLNLTETSLIK